MRYEVDDPDHPGEKINVYKLQRSDPARILPVDLRTLDSLLKRDAWDRAEAIAILAGLVPHDDSQYFNGVPTPHGYLDGTDAVWRRHLLLPHPQWERQFLPDCAMLAGYAKGEPMDERRTPHKWIAWALSKGFRPYWMDLAVAQGWIEDPVTTPRGTAQGSAAQVAEREADKARTESGADPAPEPLTTQQIALAFGRLWPGGQPLGVFLRKGVPKWLEVAIAVRAAPRSKTGHRWNPVTFAERLRDRKGIEPAKLSLAFREREELHAWRDSWKARVQWFTQYDDKD